MCATNRFAGSKEFEHVFSHVGGCQDKQNTKSSVDFSDVRCTLDRCYLCPLAPRESSVFNVLRISMLSFLIVLRSFLFEPEAAHIGALLAGSGARLIERQSPEESLVRPGGSRPPTDQARLTGSLAVPASSRSAMAVHTQEKHSGQMSLQTYCSIRSAGFPGLVRRRPPEKAVTPEMRSRFARPPLMCWVPESLAQFQANMSNLQDMVNNKKLCIVWTDHVLSKFDGPVTSKVIHKGEQK